MAGNNSIQILRVANLASTANASQIPLDGQPFYDKATRKLFIGDGTNVLANYRSLDKGVVAGGLNAPWGSILNAAGDMGISAPSIRYSYDNALYPQHINVHFPGSFSGENDITIYTNSAPTFSINTTPTGSVEWYTSPLSINANGYNNNAITLTSSSSSNIVVNAGENLNLSAANGVTIGGSRLNLYSHSGNISICGISGVNITSDSNIAIYSTFGSSYVNIGANSVISVGNVNANIGYTNAASVNVYLKYNATRNVAVYTSGIFLNYNASERVALNNLGISLYAGSSGNFRVNTSGAYLNGNMIAVKNDIPFEYIAPVVNGASYRGTNTTYIQKRANYQQFYLMPAIWGLANFNDPNLWYVDLMFDITIIGGIRGYGSGGYKYYDWNSGRLPIRYYFGWQSVEYHPIGSMTYSVNDDYNPMRYNNSFDFYRRLDLYKGTSYIWAEPSGYGGRLPSTTILNSATINDDVANSNCTFTLYGIGPIVRSTSGPIWREN